VHNWAKAGNAEAMFQSFYDVLKPGGVLGVKDHRAKPGTHSSSRSTPVISRKSM
jgi:predicted methyltransferase